MVKRMAVFCCALVLCFLAAGCDPYSGQRPFELGEYTWICQEGNYVFRFDSHPEKEDPNVLDGELAYGEETFFCRFIFIGQTNRLSILIWKDKYSAKYDSTELYGYCDLSPDSFVIHTEWIDGDFFEEFDDKLPDELTFIRTDLETSDTDSEISGADTKTSGTGAETFG